MTLPVTIQQVSPCEFAIYGADSGRFYGSVIAHQAGVPCAVARADGKPAHPARRSVWTVTLGVGVITLTPAASPPADALVELAGMVPEDQPIGPAGPPTRPESPLL